MRQLFQKILSLILAAAMLSALAIPAAASDALGEDLTTKDIPLHKDTQLSSNVFWSTTHSDLRQENLITYTPGRDVTPIVTVGSVLTERSSVTAAARDLENAGYRVVAGINGDFYNTSTGLPVGIVVTEGRLLSSDSGHYAIGFYEDGSAILGKPAVKISANLGYGVDDGMGNYTELVRTISGVNKARVSTGGIYLYTHEFNDRHTTGNTEAGVDVICSVADGTLSIGDTLTLSVEQVVDATSATAIREDQIVLSVNLKSDPYYVDALRNLPAGSLITITAAASDEAWNDVEYAVGALQALVENGAVVSGLEAGANPRTAVGLKADGTLIFYTIDGRKSGHSIGASLTQVAQRLVELGCENAVCLDGGGSTTLSVTEPDETEAKTINRPSDNSERAVTNQIFLVAENQPSGRLSHFYVSADNDYVLAGSRVTISAAAIDTNYIPMTKRYDLKTSAGTLDGNVLTTPTSGGEITVTASAGGKSGSTTIQTVKTPDKITVHSGGSALTALTAVPGSATALTATAFYRHLPLAAEAEQFAWTVSGDIGTIDASGVFTAGAPGTGTITVSAGEMDASIPVTVSRVALETVEDFETQDSAFANGSGSGLQVAHTSSSEQVRMGRGAAALRYTMEDESNLTARWILEQPVAARSNAHNSLNLWVYGDKSGNILSLLYGNGTENHLELPVTTLDFSGWMQVSVEIGSGFAIQGLGIRAPEPLVYDDGLGNVLIEYPDTAHEGTIYIDQIVASFGGTVDSEVPSIVLTTDEETLTGTISDAVDGVLPEHSVSVTLDGTAQSFTYNKSTGAFSTPQISDGGPHRITVTARDASGNIGRASYDIPVAEDWAHRFSDIADYWAANYVDYLYTAGITTGYEDGTFRPNQNISRAQFAVMLYRYLRLDESRYADVELPFADNAKIAAYAVPAIKALYTEGIINGSTGSDGKLYFHPNNSLTRAQAATMIGRTQEKGYASTALTFTDAGTIPAYATFYIQTMAAQGVIGGYTDGSFKPNNPITRGQMAKILYNLM